MLLVRHGLEVKKVSIYVCVEFQVWHMRGGRSFSDCGVSQIPQRALAEASLAC